MYKIDGKFLIEGIGLITDRVKRDLKSVDSALNLKKHSIVYIKEINRERVYLFSNDKDGLVNPITIIAEDDGVAYFPMGSRVESMILSKGYAIALIQIDE
jgi:hypothetical protein